VHDGKVVLPGVLHMRNINSNLHQPLMIMLNFMLLGACSRT
jgi:hypothetical protein